MYHMDAKEMHWEKVRSELQTNATSYFVKNQEAVLPQNSSFTRIYLWSSKSSRTTKTWKPLLEKRGTNSFVTFSYRIQEMDTIALAN